MNDMPHFTASVNINGKCVQQQEYRVEQAHRSIHVRESGRFPEHPGVTASCDFIARPEGYHSIDMRLRNPEGDMLVQVHRRSEEEVEMAANGEDAISIPIVRDDGIAYFDGPNPMFDYVNAMLLMGIRDGEERVVMMNVLQWSTSEIFQLPYTFSRNGNVIPIRKDPGEIVEARLVLDEEGGGVESYRMADEEYVFAAA